MSEPLRDHLSEVGYSEKGIDQIVSEAARLGMTPQYDALGHLIGWTFPSKRTS